MGQNAEEAFTYLSRVLASPQDRSQSAFVTRDDTLGMRAVRIYKPMKVSFHLATVFAFGPSSTAAALVERNDGRADAEFFAAETMIVLGIVTGIGEQAIPVEVLGGLPHGGRKLRRILAGSRRNQCGGDQVCAGVTDEGEFGPSAPPKTPIAHTRYVVGAGVGRSHPGGIDSTFWTCVDQAA